MPIICGNFCGANKFVMGKDVSKAKVVQEFQKNSDELVVLVEKGEYAIRLVKEVRHQSVKQA